MWKKRAAQESFLHSSHSFSLAAALTVAGVLAGCSDPGDTTSMLDLASPTEKNKQTHMGSSIFVRTKTVTTVRRWCSRTDGSKRSGQIPVQQEPHEASDPNPNPDPEPLTLSLSLTLKWLFKGGQALTGVQLRLPDLQTF